MNTLRLFDKLFFVWNHRPCLGAQFRALIKSFWGLEYNEWANEVLVGQLVIEKDIGDRIINILSIN